MKIALISPRIFKLPFPPLGLLYIGAVLEEEGHRVVVFEPEPQTNDFLEELIHLKPDLIGLTIMTPQLARAEELMMQIKSLLPHSVITCGGIHPTVCHDMIQNPDIDFIVVGEGEETMKEVCERLESGKDLHNVKGVVYKENKKIIINQPRELIRNLGDLPFPARHLLDFEEYLRPPGLIRGAWCERSTSILFSRGCPGRCIYCGSKRIFGRITRYRSIENCMEEIEFLIKTYKIDGFWVADDTLTVNRKWVTEFCHALKKHDINIKWGCQSRVNTISSELCKVMHSAGCIQLEYGVESGSPKVLSALKKDTTPEMIRNAFKMTKKAGMRTLANFIIGCPSETKEDLNMTFRLAKEIKPDFSNFYMLTPYPGTELHEMALKNNWIEGTDFSSWLMRTSIMEINFSHDELTKIRAWLQNQFTVRNYLYFIENPKYGLKLFSFILKNNRALCAGIKKFYKTKSLDNLAFEFYEKAR